MRPLAPIVLLLAACVGPSEGPSQQVPLVVRQDASVAVLGARLDLGDREQDALLTKFLERWRKARGQDELVVWAPPGSPTALVLELVARIEGAGIESYRIARTPEPPVVPEAGEVTERR